MMYYGVHRNGFGWITMRPQSKPHIKKISKSTAIGIIITTLIILIAGLYFYYQVVYRSSHELTTDAIETNTQPAVYSLNGLRWELSKQSHILDYAFEENRKKEDYGTYVIPGLLATETLKFSWETTPAMCTSMTPQGMVVAKDYVLISAYCRTGTHNSVIYVLDKKSRQFIKKVVLKGKPHVGGLAYDPDHKMIWMSGKFNGVAQANAFSLDRIKKYEFALEHTPLKYDKSYDLYSIERSSFMTYHNNSLYVGCYESGKMSVVEQYALDKNGDLTAKANPDAGFDKPVAHPIETAVISGRVQGITFHNDEVLLSQSAGIRKSDLLVFQDSDQMVTFTNEDSAFHITLPPQLEQIYAEGDDLYALFESAAYAYRGYVPVKIDRVLTLNMKKIMP